jgi:hypothetical protein
VATTTSHATVAEASEHALARSLVEVAVQRFGGNPARTQRLGDLGAVAPRVREHEHGLGRLGADHADEDLRLVVALRNDERLLDVLHRERLVLDRDVDRIAQELVGQAADRRRHRGREEGRLSVAGRRGEDLLDGVEESHAQHLVGLVEDDHAHVVEREASALEMIDHAARRADDDVDARLQCLELGPIRRAAVHRERADAERLGEDLEVALDLERELARRAEHDRSRAFVARRVAAGAAGRTPPSCPSPCARRRRRRVPRGAPGWRHPGWGGRGEADLHQGGEKSGVQVEAVETHGRPVYLSGGRDAPPRS